MLDLRLKGAALFDRKPMPTWGSDLSGIDFQNIKYFVRSTEKQATSWEDLPEDIKNTYDRLGIPEAEKQRLVAGVAAQYESEVVYHQIREDLEEQGVIFVDTDTGLREHEDSSRSTSARHPGRRQQVRRAQHRRVVRWLVHLRPAGRARRHPAAGLLPDQHREHGPVRAHADHRRRGLLRALRRGLHRADLQVSTRCTPPSSRSSSRRAPACRYTTIQNWSNNVYNLVTKRAVCEAEGAPWSGSTATSAPRSR
jgi:Fe-S cluster assembly protein SufB